MRHERARKELQLLVRKSRAKLANYMHVRTYACMPVFNFVCMHACQSICQSYDWISSHHCLSFSHQFRIRQCQHYDSRAEMHPARLFVWQKQKPCVCMYPGTCLSLCALAVVNRLSNFPQQKKNLPSGEDHEVKGVRHAFNVILCVCVCVCVCAHALMWKSRHTLLLVSVHKDTVLGYRYI